MCGWLITCFVTKSAKCSWSIVYFKTQKIHFVKSKWIFAFILYDDFHLNCWMYFAFEIEYDDHQRLQFGIPPANHIIHLPSSILSDTILNRFQVIHNLLWESSRFLNHVWKYHEWPWTVIQFICCSYRKSAHIFFSGEITKMHGMFVSPMRIEKYRISFDFLA